LNRARRCFSTAGRHGTSGPVAIVTSSTGELWRQFTHRQTANRAARVFVQFTGSEANFELRELIAGGEQRSVRMRDISLEMVSDVRQEGVDGCPLALNDDLYRSIRLVANEATDREPPGDRVRRVAETDSLNPSCKDDALTVNRRLSCHAAENRARPMPQRR